MKKYTKILAASIMALGAVACSSQLDSVEQYGAKETDSYYANATDDNAEALISSVYLSSWNTKTNGMSLYTDDYVGHERYTSENADGFLGDLDIDFTTLYQINYKCNLIIEKLNADTDVKKRVVAEAYFFRAWAFFNLIRCWGNPPLVDHVLAADELTPENGNAAELWDYVQTSLDKAIEGLPSKSGLGTQHALGARVTKEAAYALKGKAYLWAGDNAKAKEALAEVINSNKYKLLDDFSDLYTIKADFSDEYIWEWNAADDDDANKTSEYKIYVSDNWRGENVQMPGGSHLSGFGGGWLENYTSPDFYNFLVNRGELGKARQMGTVWSFDQAAQKYIDLSDPSLAGTANYEGDGLNKYIAEGCTPMQAAYRMLWTGDYSIPTLTYCAGYLPAKVYMWHSDMYDMTGTTNPISKANYPAMRYAEVLLLYAEACDGSQEGLDALNTVRLRAGLDKLTSYTLADVQDEKRAELWGEGERFFDAIRWGKAADWFKEVGKYKYSVMGDKATYTNTVVREDVTGWLGWSSRYEKFPYSTSELAQNPNLNQNTGW